jgi:hypothetical protein
MVLTSGAGGGTIAVLPVKDVIVPVMSGCDLAARPRPTRTPAENAGDGAPLSLDEIPGEYSVAKCVDGPEM